MNNRDCHGSAASARSVLAVGVSVQPQYEDGIPPLDALHPLDEAPYHAASVALLLKGFGYAPHVSVGQRGKGAGDPGEEIRRAVTSREISLLIVHIVAHGRLAERAGRLECGEVEADAPGRNPRRPAVPS